MRPRDVLRLHADKLRIGIVLRIAQDDLFIITGSTQDHDLPRVTVHPDSKQGRAMELTAETYFYARDAGWWTISDVDRVGARISIELFLAIERLIDEDGSFTPSAYSWR